MMIWVMIVLMNYEMCVEGFEEVGGVVNDEMVMLLVNVFQLVVNNLEFLSLVVMISKNKVSKDYDVVLVGRRLMGYENVGYLKWVLREKRQLFSILLENMIVNIKVF